MRQFPRLLAFPAVVLRSFARDRTALVFVLVLPVAIIVIIGTSFGGGPELRVGVVGADRGRLAHDLGAALRSGDGLEVHDYAGLDDLERAVRRDEVGAGLVVPGDLDPRVAEGGSVAVGFVTKPASQTGMAARTAVQGSLDRLAARIGAAQVVTRELGGGFSDNLALAAGAAQPTLVDVRVTDVGRGGDRDLNQFSLTAPQTLVLFVFVNSLASAGFLVRTRERGVLTRAVATPSGAGTIVVGLTVGWFVFALLQSLIIVAAGALLFAVDWGDPVAAVVLVVVAALVGSGAGLLAGALGRNEDRVSAVTPIVGLVLSALGGCMVPLEVFPPAMRAVAHAVPPYWALEGWRRLIFDGAGLGSVLGHVAVLLVFAAALLGGATVLLRRQLARG